MQIFIHGFISYLFLMSSTFCTIAYGQGETAEVSGKRSMNLETSRQLLAKLESGLAQRVRQYNKSRHSIRQLLKLFPKEDHRYLQKITQKFKLTSLPKMVRKGNDYQLKVAGHLLKFSPADISKYQLHINQRVLSVKNYKGLQALHEKMTALLAAKKKTSGLFLQILGLDSAFAAGWGALAAVVTIGGGAIAVWMSKKLDLNFVEAQAMVQSFQRVQEIANLCDINKGDLLKDLKKGVTEENKLIHHLIVRTSDFGYDPEELIEEMSRDYSDDCAGHGEKLAVGLLNKKEHFGMPLRIRDSEQLQEYIKEHKAKRDGAIEKMGCASATPKSFLFAGDLAGAAYAKAEEKLKTCLVNSCQKLIDRHDSCLKYLHSHTDRSARDINAKKLEQFDLNWDRKIDVKVKDKSSGVIPGRERRRNLYR